MPKYIHDYPPEFFEGHTTHESNRRGKVQVKDTTRRNRGVRYENQPKRSVLHWNEGSKPYCGRGGYRSNKTKSFHEVTCGACRIALKIYLNKADGWVEL